MSHAIWRFFIERHGNFFESLALGRNQGRNKLFLIFHILEIRVSLNSVEFIQPTWDLIYKETSEENLST
jgi:hypothetical protein